jgi:hypothetical protein
LRQLSSPRPASTYYGYGPSSAADKAAAGRILVGRSIPSALHEVLTPTGVVMPKVVHQVLEAQVRPMAGSIDWCMLVQPIDSFGAW